MTRINLHRHTTQEWADMNPIIPVGDFALDLTKGTFKIGDGVLKWSKLVTFTPLASSGPAAPTAIDGGTP